MMSLRYSVLCLVLFFFVLLLGFKNYEIWTQPVELFSEKGMMKKSGTKSETPPVTGGQKEPTPIEFYIFIAEKNIFNFDRKEFPIPPAPEPAKEMKKPIVRPKIILYGVTIAGNYQSASIANPGRALQKREREIMTVRAGDRVGEYRVAKILPDRIIMEDTEDSFEVLLYDPRAPKQRTYVKTESKPATITSALPSPTTVPTGGPQPPPPQPGEPISGKVIETQMPMPVTPAPMPSPRTRRWYGPRPPGED